MFFFGSLPFTFQYVFFPFRALNEKLQQLWESHLHSMKSMDVEDCLSLEHLGLILHHLSNASMYRSQKSTDSFI